MSGDFLLQAYMEFVQLLETTICMHIEGPVAPHTTVLIERVLTKIPNLPEQNYYVKGIHVKFLLFGQRRLPDKFLEHRNAGIHLSLQLELNDRLHSKRWVVSEIGLHHHLDKVWVRLISLRPLPTSPPLSTDHDFSKESVSEEISHVPIQLDVLKLSNFREAHHFFAFGCADTIRAARERQWSMCMNYNQIPGAFSIPNVFQHFGSKSFIFRGMHVKQIVYGSRPHDVSFDVPSPEEVQAGMTVSFMGCVNALIQPDGLFATLSQPAEARRAVDLIIYPLYPL